MNININSTPIKSAIVEIINRAKPVGIEVDQIRNIYEVEGKIRVFYSINDGWLYQEEDDLIDINVIDLLVEMADMEQME